MRFLIAGFGSIGRRHLRNLRALGAQGAHDILLYRTHRSTLPDDETQGLPVETDLAQALAHRPDAVIVANPTAAHMEVAIPAAEAGCALLIEKPVAHSLDRSEELARAVEKNGGRALVGFQFRFHPGLQAAKRLLDEGAIGRPVSARAHWGEYLPGWHPWEDYRQGYSARADLGGGVVLTLSHPIDYLRWLLGEVDRVSAETASLGDLGIGVEDTAEMIFRFKQGALASLHLDYVQRPPAHTLEIIGTEGTLRWDNATGETALFHGAAPLKTFPVPDGFERNDLFLAEMRHFIEVARGAAAPLCPLSDGLRALELALAVHRSSAEGRMINV
jgi:predicted dehydrogenase